MNALKSVARTQRVNVTILTLSVRGSILDRQSLKHFYLNYDDRSIPTSGKVIYTGHLVVVFIVVINVLFIHYEVCTIAFTVHELQLITCRN